MLSHGPLDKVNEGKNGGRILEETGQNAPQASGTAATATIQWGLVHWHGRGVLPLLYNLFRIATVSHAGRDLFARLIRDKETAVAGQDDQCRNAPNLQGLRQGLFEGRRTRRGQGQPGHGGKILIKLRQIVIAAEIQDFHLVVSGGIKLFEQWGKGLTGGTPTRTKIQEDQGFGLQGLGRRHGRIPSAVVVVAIVGVVLNQGGTHHSDPDILLLLFLGNLVR